MTYCAHPTAALEAIQADPARFDLLLTDFTMPDLTGMDLARKAWEARPGLPAILMTGYSDKMSREEAQRLGFADFLIKPISTSDIARSIQKALGL